MVGPGGSKSVSAVRSIFAAGSERARDAGARVAIHQASLVTAKMWMPCKLIQTPAGSWVRASCSPDADTARSSSARRLARFTGGLSHRWTDAERADSGVSGRVSALVVHARRAKRGSGFFNAEFGFTQGRPKLTTTARRHTEHRQPRILANPHDGVLPRWQSTEPNPQGSLVLSNHQAVLLTRDNPPLEDGDHSLRIDHEISKVRQIIHPRTADRHIPQVGRKPSEDPDRSTLRQRHRRAHLRTQFNLTPAPCERPQFGTCARTIRGMFACWRGTLVTRSLSTVVLLSRVKDRFDCGTNARMEGAFSAGHDRNLAGRENYPSAKVSGLAGAVQTEVSDSRCAERAHRPPGELAALALRQRPIVDDHRGRRDENQNPAGEPHIALLLAPAPVHRLCDSFPERRDLCPLRSRGDCAARRCASGADACGENTRGHLRAIDVQNRESAYVVFGRQRGCRATDPTEHDRSLTRPRSYRTATGSDLRQGLARFARPR